MTTLVTRFTHKLGLDTTDIPYKCFWKWLISQYCSSHC